MAILDRLNQALLFVGDPLFNWLLRLPVDLALLLVAIGTGALMVFMRPFTTNQDLLRRCAADKQRLKQLIREAKARRDRAAVKRYRLTQNQIGITAMKQEGWPLLAVIVPVAILGTWCFQRLAFIPPKAGETIEVKAYFPAYANGELAHLVPQPGLREVSGDAAAGWIQTIVPDEIETTETAEVTDPVTKKTSKQQVKKKTMVGAYAVWKLQADARLQPYALEVRYREHSVTTDLLVGQRTYTPDLIRCGLDKPIQGVQIALKEVKLFGIVPGIGFLYMAPWLVAYFLIAIPAVFLVKALARIH